LAVIDVIGHVIEKDVMKETEKNGKRSKVMDVMLEDLEWVLFYIYIMLYDIIWFEPVIYWLMFSPDDCRSNRLHCTLWDEYAKRMHQFLDSHDPVQPVVLILQLCKIKRFFGFFLFL